MLACTTVIVPAEASTVTVGLDRNSGRLMLHVRSNDGLLVKPEGGSGLHIIGEFFLPIRFQLMAVNSAGQRFVNESTSYHEFVLGMYRSHKTVPTFPAFLVCDAPFMERWGMGLALPGGRPREHLVQAGYLYRADTLDGLAAQLGIDAAGLKAEIEAAIAEAKTAIESGDPAEMTAKTQALTEVAMKMGQAIYEQEQAAGASAAPSEEAPADDNVVDAEFKEVKRDQK